MTKEVEIVDIGGEAFSLVRLADQFNKGAYIDIHCSCAKREIFDFASFVHCTVFFNNLRSCPPSFYKILPHLCFE